MSDTQIISELRSLWTEQTSGFNKHPAGIWLSGDRFRRWFEGLENPTPSYTLYRVEFNPESAHDFPVCCSHRRGNLQKFIDNRSDKDNWVIRETDSLPTYAEWSNKS